MFRSTALSAAIVAAAVVFAGTSSSQAETGTVRFQVAKAGFIVGVGGGSGVLHFKGKTYRLHVDGISAGTIGIARADLVGTASNLQTAADIVGTYTAASASVAVSGGGKAAQLQNAKGVLLELRGQQVGFEASFNLGGVTISMR